MLTHRRWHRHRDRYDRSRSRPLLLRAVFDHPRHSMSHHTDTTGASPVALQLWTIREAFAADADRALSEVKAAGFSAVELAPLPPGLTPDRLAESLARHALTVVSIHGDL